MKARINNTSNGLLVAEFEEEEELLRTSANQTSSRRNNCLLGKEGKTSDIEEKSYADDEV